MDKEAIEAADDSALARWEAEGGSWLWHGSKSQRPKDPSPRSPGIVSRFWLGQRLPAAMEQPAD